MKYVDVKSNSAKSEGLYWKYEEWIRKNESKFGRCITMNGGNMAMVAGLFEELHTFVPNDFDIPIRLVSNYKTSFSSKSIGEEKSIVDVNEELRRKKRMANRQMNAIKYRWKSFDLITKLQLLFHKIIRWFALPLLLLVLLFQAVVSFVFSISFLFHSLLTMFIVLLIILLLDKLFNYQIKIFNLIAYAFQVHFFASIGASQALFGQKVSLWGSATSNRS